MRVIREQFPSQTGEVDVAEGELRSLGIGTVDVYSLKDGKLLGTVALSSGALCARLFLAYGNGRCHDTFDYSGFLIEDPEY